MVKITFKLAQQSPGAASALGVDDDTTKKIFDQISQAHLQGGLAFEGAQVAGGVSYPHVALNPTPDQTTKVSLDFVHKIADRDVETAAAKAAGIAADTADRLMSNFFPWVGRNFMSGSMTYLASAALYEAGVSWKPLSPRYLARKQKLGRNPGFWRFSNSLYRQFTSGNSKRRGLFGETKVATSGVGTKIDIKISLGTRLAGILVDNGQRLTTSQRLEQDIVDAGFSGNADMVRKLQGRQAYYRPLLGPALLFYVNQVVKPTVINELAKAGYKMKRLKAAANTFGNQG